MCLTKKIKTCTFDVDAIKVSRKNAINLDVLFAALTSMIVLLNGVLNGI